MHEFAYILGLSSANGWPYLLWSGVVGDLTFVGAGVAIYRRHTCHVDRCWRIARHPVADSPYVVCARHHPDVPPIVTAEHVERHARRR